MQLTAPLARRLSRLSAFAVRLRDCRSGLALIEFAASAPVLMALGLYGLETANLAIANSKVSNIAMLTADNASRVRDSIDEFDIVQLFTGADTAGSSIGFAQNGRIVLSSLEASPDGTKQWIHWQRCIGAAHVSSNYGTPLTGTGTAIANGTEVYGTDRHTAAANPSTYTRSTLARMGTATNPIVSSVGTAVMVAEVTYTYQPIVSSSLFGPITIHYESAFNVRQRSDQTLYNANRVTPDSCDQYDTTP